MDSASYSVRSFVSDWSTASVSLPVDDLFSEDQLEKETKKSFNVIEP